MGDGEAAVNCLLQELEGIRKDSAIRCNTLRASVLILNIDLTLVKLTSNAPGVRMQDRLMKI